MSECRSEYTKLPPGWDCKIDQSTGKCYYINYLTKTMQVEDPRIRYKQLQNERCSTESIPMQPLHGSPYHVYPASNFPAVKAFQGPNPSLQSVSASPLLSTKSQIQMEMSPLLRQGSPMANLPRRQTIQETSFSNNIDTDAVVAKINNMFPTASDNHIRLLLKKYYNREAVVISALQVEKHPVTMPGPFATPPSQRHLFHSNSAFQMTPPTRRIDAIISRTGSPIPGRPGSVASGLYGSPRIGGDQMRNSPKPHSSPKMKLRYLKNVFPKADETLLLDVLANADNNVQIASEKLIGMGYTKRDVAPPRLNYRVKGNDDKREQEKIIPLHPKVLTAEQKTQIKARLEERYKNIAERIISMALESVNFSEDRAIQILQIVQQEDETKARKDSAAEDSIKENEIIPEESQPGTESSCNRDITPKITSDSSSASQTSASQALSSARAQDATDSTATTCFVTSSDMRCYLGGGNQGDPPSSSSSVTSSPTEGVKKTERTRYRDKSDSLKNSPRGSTEEDADSMNKSEFKSLLGRVNSKGHDTELAKGPDDSLLLADYVTWNGANPDISLGRKGIATGSDPALLCERNANANARGHNPELCKGPNVGLAKGSIYSQLNRSLTANVKCN